MEKTLEVVLICLLFLFISILLWLFSKLLNSFRLQEAAITVRDFTKGHHWVIVEAFDAGHYCNICETGIFHGLCCDFCGIVVDDSCAISANSTLPCKCLASSGSLKHHWVRGNLPPINNVCSVCDEDCGLGPGLKDVRCCWCQRVCHDNCLLNFSSICDMGKFKSLIIPPNLVVLKDRGVWKASRNRLVVNKIIASPDSDGVWSPLIVVANRKSGSGEGEMILQTFRRILNPIQVFDLSEIKPEVCLQMLRLISTECRIFVAGGDGTVGWILDSLEKLKEKFNNMEVDGESFPSPELFVFPLGTGNDLSRYLGGGSGHSGPVQLDDVFNALNSSKSIQVDRWRLIVEQKRLGVNLPRKHLKMTNYASIGVDALVTLNFHRRRYAVPRVMSGRLMNKLLFFTYGTKDVLERACRNLHNLVELYIDDTRVELPELEGITFLNIPFWGAGVKVWDLGSRAERGDEKQRVDDGILEVFGLYSSFHIAQLQVGLSEPFRLGRGKNIRLIIKQGVVPMQVDGEPWRQGPCVVHISHYGTAKFLALEGEESLIKTPTENDKSSRVGFFL